MLTVDRRNEPRRYVASPGHGDRSMQMVAGMILLAVAIVLGALIVWLA